MNNTTVPNTPNELILQNTKLTPEQLGEKFAQLTYEEQDNFIFHLLQVQRNFHQFLLEKSKKGDKNLPNTEQLVIDVTKLELICKLYEEIE